MADHTSIPSATDKYRKHSSFPKLFTGFSFKSFSETAEAVMSPTSILDSKSFYGLKNPFWSDPNPSPKTTEAEARRHWDKLETRGIGLGLAIVDALSDEDKGNPSKLSKPESRMVLFGSQLKIQIPSLPLSPMDSPQSPGEFGIKTRNSHLGSFSSGLSPSPVRKSAFGSANSEYNSGMDTPNSPRVFTGCLSAAEMELSEDYTCVITHGPVPKTTHIFEDCVVESCYGVVGFSASPREINPFPGDPPSYPSGNFLSCCYACKKKLGQGKDIYMYRGDKAFCSRECRYQEMLLEEELDDS